MHPNNILFNKKNEYFKIPNKHSSIQHNYFLAKISVFTKRIIFSKIYSREFIL